MTSAINPSKPTATTALTADVRANFAAAASEISALQVNAFVTGNQTPVAGSAMRVDNQLQIAALNTLTAEAGIFPGGNSYSFVGVNKEFNSSGPAGGSAPFTGLFSLVTNNQSGADVVSIFGDAIAQTATDAVWGGNLLVRNKVSGAKLIGLEIDVAAAPGTTISGQSGGLFINAFNIATSAAAIQLGGVAGGTFGNGILINGVTGAGLAAQASTPSMASLINAQNGTYTTDAVVLGNTQAIRFLSGGSAPANRLANDAGGSWQFTGGNGSLSVNGFTGGASDGYASFVLRMSGTPMGNYYADNHTDPTLPVAGTAIGTFAGFPFFITGDSGAVIAHFNGATNVASFGGKSGAESLRVVPIASAVNFIEADGATTGNAPLLSSRGEANTGFNFALNGNGSHRFYTNGPSYTQQFEIDHTASATNIIKITGSNGGNPTISTSGGNLAVTPALVCASTITCLGGTTLLTTSSALTDGAGASAGTLTNAPTVGNPTKWIQINDNGTTRKIPTWT